MTNACFLNFSNKVLDISSGIDDVGYLRWELVAYLALAWITVYFVVWKGLHNSGKVMLEIFLLFWLKNVYFFYYPHVVIRVILSIILYGFLFVSISNFWGALLDTFWLFLCNFDLVTLFIVGLQVNKLKVWWIGQILMETWG